MKKIKFMLMIVMVMVATQVNAISKQQLLGKWEVLYVQQGNEWCYVDPHRYHYKLIFQQNNKMLEWKTTNGGGPFGTEKRWFNFGFITNNLIEVSNQETEDEYLILCVDKYWKDSRSGTEWIIGELRYNMGYRNTPDIVKIKMKKMKN